MSFEVSQGAAVAWLLIFVRCTAWLVVCPPFSSRTIPMMAKTGMAGWLSVLLVARVDTSAAPLELAPFLAAILAQVLAGLVLGFLTLMLFSAVQAAGEMVDNVAGFNMASMFDPITQTPTSVFGRFYNLIAVTLLFAIDGHLLLVRGFIATFDAVPTVGTSGDMASLLAVDVGRFFIGAVQIAAPVLAVLLLAELALGLLARAAPQMNVFVVGMSPKILLAIAVVGMAIPLLPAAVSSILSHILDSWADALRALGAR